MMIREKPKQKLTLLLKSGYDPIAQIGCACKQLKPQSSDLRTFGARHNSYISSWYDSDHIQSEWTFMRIFRWCDNDIYTT